MKTLYKNGAPEATDQLYALACGPDPRATKYTSCIANGVRFHTKDRDSRRRSQNSGLVVKGEHDNDEISFYGFLTNIIQLDYIKCNRAILFECEWYEADKKKKSGIQKDKHFTSINVNGRWYKNDPYVLAMQAKQVFYLNDTKLGKNWQVVQEFQQRNFYDPDIEKLESDSSDEVNGYGVYQENEPSEVIEVDQVDVDKLQRDDANAETIEIPVEQVEKAAIPDEDDFINDHIEDEDEDETLVEYYENEEDNTYTDDDDTDVD